MERRVEDPEPEEPQVERIDLSEEEYQILMSLRDAKERGLISLVIAIDQKLQDKTVELMAALGKTDRAAIYRLGVAFLSIAVDARDEGLHVGLFNEEGKIVKELTLPTLSLDKL